jgi:hypothetical protein
VGGTRVWIWLDLFYHSFTTFYHFSPPDHPPQCSANSKQKIWCKSDRMTVSACHCDCIQNVCTKHAPARFNHDLIHKTRPHDAGHSHC